MDPAPDNLALAQDLLNTMGVGSHADLLADVPAATAWAAEVTSVEVKLTEADVAELRAFRADLQHLIAPDSAATGMSSGAAAGDPPSVTTAERPHRTPLSGSRTVAAELVLGVDGVVELRAGGAGAEYVISRVLGEVLSGQQLDTWRRLKSCRNPACRVAFYDRSRNNSGVWHSLKSCGNPANLRAFRARNTETSS